MGIRQIGNYRLVDYVGSGGFGSVFKAEDISNPGRVVAVKELHKKHTRSTTIKQRFFQEAVAMARLDHPNLPRLYTFGEDNGSYYLVMEFVSGKLLSEEIAETGGLSPDRAIAIMTQVLEAVSYAHRNGIIHRDLKPENIIITDSKDALGVKVLDFGIAKMVGGENLTLTGEGFGTPAYMSPERIVGRSDLDLRTDIYSLGIILCEMLTGKAPFESVATDPGVFWTEMRAQHESAPLPDLSALNVAPEVEAAVKRAAAKRSGDRYATAEEMLEELRGSKATARLLLVSQPGSAEVYVDNILRGLTEQSTGRIVIEGLAAGIHGVRVSRQGFTPYKIDLSLERGQETELQVQLAARATVAIPRNDDTSPVDVVTKRAIGGDDAKTAVLVLDSLPRGSRVNVGAADTAAIANEDGRATVMLPEGSHEITVKSPTGVVRKERVTVVANEVGATKTISLPLVAQQQPRASNITTYTSGTKGKKRAAMTVAAILVLALSAAAYIVFRGTGRNAMPTTSASAQPDRDPNQAAAPGADSNTSGSAVPQQQDPAQNMNSNSRAAASGENKPLKTEQGNANKEAGKVDTEPVRVAKPSVEEERQNTVPAPSPATPDGPRQLAGDETAAATGCVGVLVVDPSGEPVKHIRVVIIEQPGAASPNVTEGRTGANGRFHACGLTPGRILRVTVLGPAGGLLGSKQSIVPRGREQIVIQIGSQPNVTDGGPRPDRRRPIWRRP